MRDVHPTPEHKREALWKLEQYNTEQEFLRYETRLGPHRSPHSSRAQGC